MKTLQTGIENKTKTNLESFNYHDFLSPTSELLNAIKASGMGFDRLYLVITYMCCRDSNTELTWDCFSYTYEQDIIPDLDKKQGMNAEYSEAEKLAFRIRDSLSDDQKLFCARLTQKLYGLVEQLETDGIDLSKLVEDTSLAAMGAIAFPEMESQELMTLSKAFNKAFGGGLKLVEWQKDGDTVFGGSYYVKLDKFESVSTQFDYNPEKEVLSIKIHTSPQNGMGQVIEGLGENLHMNGLAWTYSSSVTQDNLVDALVTAKELLNARAKSAFETKEKEIVSEVDEDVVLTPELRYGIWQCFESAFGEIVVDYTETGAYCSYTVKDKAFQFAYNHVKHSVVVTDPSEEHKVLYEAKVEGLFEKHGVLRKALENAVDHIHDSFSAN